MNLHLFLDVAAWGIAVLATGICWAARPARRPIVEFVVALILVFICWAWIVAG